MANHSSGEMRAVVWDAGRGGFEEIVAPLPQPEGHDLLVEVAAASVNPVDGKVILRGGSDMPPRPLGFDACGRVRAAGPEAEGFAPGDRVWYAGAVDRWGSNASHQLVDARIVAKAPESLEDADAAAIPLTALTAWEGLFERLRLVALSATPQRERLLVINGAGGVGSILLQLARASGIAATATAGRAESRDWCLKMGAAEVVGHDALDDLPPDSFERIFCAYETDSYFDRMARLVAPQGIMASIVGATRPLDLMPLFQKSAGFVWEYMFTRPVFGTADMARQGEILVRVAALFDAGRLIPTRTRTLDGLSAASLAEAHRLLAEGRMKGKLVIRY